MGFKLFVRLPTEEKELDEVLIKYFLFRGISKSVFCHSFFDYQAKVLRKVEDFSKKLSLYFGMDGCRTFFIYLSQPLGTKGIS